MFRKIAAASLVVVWLAVFGLEFLEAFTLDDPEPNVHKSTRTTLTSLGQAITISDEIEKSKSYTISAQARDSYPPIIQNISLQSFKEKSKLLKKDFKIYKLHRVFLI